MMNSQPVIATRRRSQNETAYQAQTAAAPTLVWRSLSDIKVSLSNSAQGELTGSTDAMLAMVVSSTAVRHDKRPPVVVNCEHASTEQVSSSSESTPISSIRDMLDSECG
ncbi:hypothetical protein sr17168 [Sporisorium reilianum SRZ2]|uniref:Uncharacterized protein n=1 Tax=Sporisorium reilianum (strain SRZ2) TaxID=999809 RepID=E6ZWP1_SPORE|nr:hypothetical protein sr17168 [Sporisorium reilianum SRZ2]